MLTGREQGSVLSIDHTDFMNNIANSNVAIYILPQGFALLKKIDIFQCKIGGNKDTLITQVSETAIVSIDQLGIDNSLFRIYNCEIYDNISNEWIFRSTIQNSDLSVINLSFIENKSISFFYLGDFNNVILNQLDISDNITSITTFFSLGSNKCISIQNTLFNNNQSTSAPNEPFLQIENIK